VANTYTSAGRWDTVLFVVMHSVLCLQVLSYQCIQISANHFLGLDVNVLVIIVIVLKEVIRQMTVYTELRWVVFGCCGVVL